MFMVVERLEPMSKNRILLEVNEFQTPITSELKKSLDPEVYANLIEFIHTYIFQVR